MGASVEVMRRGMVPYALTRQPVITQGLNELRDRVREAQSALNREQPSGNDLEAALGRAERLREQLEQLKNSPQGRQQGAQQGQQGQEGQQGQQGQAPGQQPGRGQSQSPAGTTGSVGPGGGSPGIVSGYGGHVDPAAAERAIREGAHDLAQLEQMLRGNRDVPREVNRDVQDLIRDWQQVDLRWLGRTHPERLDQIVGDLTGRVEQIELELRRLADAGQSGSVRSSAQQPAPPGYADSIAEYFRRLAKQK